jgi:hypothetical protein
MENITTTIDGNTVTLETLRHNVAEAVKRAYGAEREYAVALNTMFASFDWFEVEANDVRDEAKPVHAEKLALYKELKGANHSNPSTVWARIRKYGKEEKYGKPETNGAEGAEGAEGEGAGNTARDPMTRNIDELLALYKFNARQESLNDKVKNAQVHITNALKALGVNLDLVK